MDGEYDAVMEDALPPPSSIDVPPHDPEPGIRHEYAIMEYELDVFERQTPDAPRHREEQPQPRSHRVEDLLHDRSRQPVSDSLGLPGILEWNDDGAWNDGFGLDVVESF